MPAIKQNAEHWRGDSRLIQIPIREEDGSPVDMAGGTARWWLGRSVTSVGDRVLIKKAVGSGVSLSVDDGLWTAEIKLQPADTQALAPGDYYHELEIVDVQGNVSTVTTGRFRINPTLVTPP